MRIDKLKIKNFRGFEKVSFDFHPGFNLLVGENASGKTSILDALSVAAGSWFLGIGGYHTRHIQEGEIRRSPVQSGETITLEAQYPVVVEAEGVLEFLPIHGQNLVCETIHWSRDIEKAGGKTRFKKAVTIKKLASEVESRVQRGERIPLPLIAYYGAGRLWVPAKDMEGGTADKESPPPSRLDGYKTSIDPRISSAALFRWLANEKYVALERSAERHVFQVVKEAMRSCLEGCTSLDYEIAEKTIVVTMERGKRLPYHLLSDGQRAMLALVADIAIKAAVLNPQMEDRVLDETCGVVLIDELDLHLHPRWQRHVVSDLKRSFPKLQFFASTHSPQVIGETPHDEIILLKSDGSWSRPDSSIGLHANEVLREIMGAEIVNAEAAKEYNEIANLIDAGEFESAQTRIAEYRSRMGCLPELEASEVYMARVEELATARKEED
jgi:predicted ATP-binding protein involved in virulence